MELKLYDTLTREKRDVCGSSLRIPNACACMCAGRRFMTSPISAMRGPVIVFDVLYRLLRHLYGADHVKYVRNITDVDDKINARAAEQGISIRELTEEHLREFQG